MSSPEKPFACEIPDCGMTFTNEDHLNVHAKKHDMVLQLALGQKGVPFVDQTPTPTRFIRNCEEVGLFQDLQNVNPFDETFKRAMETRSCSLDTSDVVQGDDVLHTPHIFPHLSEDSPTPTFATALKVSAAENVQMDHHDKPTDTQGSDDNSKKPTCTVATTQRHSLGVQKGLITHSVDASLQLPVISVSESTQEPCRCSSLSKIRSSKVLIRNGGVLTSADSLQLPTAQGVPSIQLISQRSIEQALDNFTNECKESKTHTSGIRILENRPIKNFMQGEAGLKRLNSEPVISIEQAPAKETNKTTLIQGLATDNQNSGGYELLLKLPDGKKVLLREAEKVPESTLDNKTAAKEALKDMVSKNIQKKVLSGKVAIPARPNVLTYPNTMKYVQGVLATETIAKAQVFAVLRNQVHNPKQVHIKVAEPKESKEAKSSPIGKQNEKDGNDASNETKYNNRNIDDKEKCMAASRRYRFRKKENHRLLIEQNRKLQLENDTISRQLVASLFEVKRLRDYINTHLKHNK